MKTESEILYNQFSRAKKNQKYIWITSFVFLTIVFIAMLVFLYFKSNQVAMFSENGQKVEGTMVDGVTLFKATSKKHIAESFHYLNSFNRINFESNKGKALFYIDARACSRVWKKYEKEGVFADIITKGTVYKAEVIPNSIKVSGNNEPFNFVCQGIITVIDNGFVTKYLTTAKGKLIYYTPKFPEKPTGFFITDYNQNMRIYEDETN